MRSKITLLCALLAAGPAFAQTTGTVPPPSNEVQVNAGSGLVSIASRGKDVRDVLFDLFDQTKKNFVLETGVRFYLYLNLKEVAFDEALAIVLRNAELEFEVQNGIYYINKAKPNPPVPKPEVKVIKPQPVTPLGKLTDADLQKRVTTKLAMTDIRAVFGEFSKQTGIKIEVSSNVPQYKLDAFLNATSLKYALDVITQAADLVYTRTDMKTILIDIKRK